MFYVKHNREEVTIDSGNVYTHCAGCNKELGVDLCELLRDGSTDLEGTQILCAECSKPHNNKSKSN